MILTDYVLLEIFDFYRHTHDDTLWEWHILAHVCRRWRQIVFESPCRLGLKIRCTPKTPARKNLGIWPAFPIAIDFCSTSFDSIPGDAIAALEHADRVASLKLDLTASDLRSKTFATLTSKPFPILTHLILYVEDRHTSLLPGDFLGGSAPRLQSIHLRNITFTALQSLLLTASDLVELQLRKIPKAGNMIYPSAMVICLAQLPRLKTLVLQFRSAFPLPVHPHPVTRSVLPALTNFEFMGTSQYLEEFVAQIDCPRLNQIAILYQIQPAIFQVPQLAKFFNRSISPFRHANVCFDEFSVTFDLYRPTNRTGWDSHHPATTIISCKPIISAWYLFRILDGLSVTLATVVDLKFMGNSWANSIVGDQYNLEWLHFLRQPSALRALYVPPQLAEIIGRALKFVKGEVVAEALPSLDLICLEDQASYIEEFVAFRQLSDRPLTVVGTEAEFDQRLGERLRMSYTHRLPWIR